MNTNTITSIEDLAAALNAPVETYTAPESTLGQKLRAVLLYIPTLVAVGLVTVATAALVWWSRYGDEVLQGLWLLLNLWLTSEGIATTGNWQN